MKLLRFLFMIVLVFSSCEEEKPAPDRFLEYNNPFYEGLDTQKLMELDQLINNGKFGDIHSLIILRNERIVFENYYSGYNREDLHAIGASTQSIVSSLVGILLSEDSTITTRTKIIDLLPEYSQYFDNVPQKDKIEIRHLLANRSGLWWDEWSHPFGDDKNDAYTMTLSNDWIKSVLATPMIREPGYEFNYNSGNAILMAPIFEWATRSRLEDFAQEKLFDPLEIKEYIWEEIPDDYVNSAWGLHLKPIDMAKIGYLYLKEGNWKGQQLFSENWVHRSTIYRSHAINNFAYAYFWWKFEYYSDVIKKLVKNDLFFSWGDGGQYIFVIPHLEMVVVSTAGNYNGDETITFDMLKDYVIGSVANPF